MLITNLSMQKKNVSRINISLDNEFKGVLFDELVYSNGLKVGSELSEQELNKLIDESQQCFCKNDAFNYLSRYIKTEKELKEHLYSKGYHKNAVEFAISNVKKYNLIDDYKFAENYYKMYKDVKSYLTIKNALKLKGISEQIIEEVVCYDEDSEEELASRLVNKLYKSEDNTITYKNLNKLKRQLLTRGINYDVVNKATAFLTVVSEENYD